MTVALRMLAVGEEAGGTTRCRSSFARVNRDVEQPAFFPSSRQTCLLQDPTACSRRRRSARTTFPFLSFGGMDGRQDQVVFVQPRHAGLVAGWRPGGSMRQSVRKRSREGYPLAICSSWIRLGAPHLGGLRGFGPDAVRTTAVRVSRSDGHSE